MANNLKAARVSAGLSQADLAAKMHVTKQSISLYENGQRDPKLSVWETMADLLGVSVSYLIGDASRPDGADAAVKMFHLSPEAVSKELEKATGHTDIKTASAEAVRMAVKTVMNSRLTKIKEKHLTNHDALSYTKDLLHDIFEEIAFGSEWKNNLSEHDFEVVTIAIGEALKILVEETNRRKKL